LEEGTELEQRSELEEGEVTPSATGTPAAAAPPPSETQGVQSNKMDEMQTDVPSSAAQPANSPAGPSMSQRTPPSTPPTFLRDQTVQPLSGLLVSNNTIEVVPPSSQSTMPSPSPNPDFRLLNAPRTRTRTGNNGGDALEGRMTRSRSRSVSIPPAEPPRRPSPIRRKSSRKPGSRK